MNTSKTKSSIKQINEKYTSVRICRNMDIDSKILEKMGHRKMMYRQIFDVQTNIVEFGKKQIMYQEIMIWRYISNVNDGTYTKEAELDSDHYQLTKEIVSEVKKNR